jgi:hypothetical protein
MVEQDSLIGTRLGKYRLVGRLGRGGMGTVYRGEDLQLQRAVAVKVLSADSAPDAAAIHRFVSEARAAARLNHPNVVAVYDVGQQGSVSYIVMELVEGVSAQALLHERGTLPWPQATRIIADVCSGLAAAHAAGLIHRDVKPANILLGPGGTAKLSDFGVAKAPQRVAVHATDPGTILGTPQYMSPEQCAGDSIDARGDVYALGGSYYALLTGSPPYDESDRVRIMYAHCTAPVPDPSRFVPALPEACTRIVRKAMAKERADRFRSPLEMLTALTAVLASAPPDPAPTTVTRPARVPVPPETTVSEQPLVLTSRPPRTRPPRRRFVRAGAALALVALVALGLVIGAITYFRPPQGVQPKGDDPAPAPAPPYPAGQLVTLRPRPSWGKHEGGSFALAFGGRRFATVGADKLARVWNLDRPEEPARQFLHPHALNCVALSPDGKWLATGGRTASFVTLWDADAGKELGKLEVTSGPWSLAFDPSGKRLAVGSGGRLQLLELNRAGAEIKRWRLPGEPYAVTGVAFTRDGRRLGATTYQPGAYWLDGANLEQIAFVANPEGVELFAAGAISADGKRVALARRARTSHELFLWEPETSRSPQFVTRETGGAVISAMAFAPGGRQIAHGGTFGGPVKLHDLVSGGSFSYPTNVSGNVMALAFSPDGRILAATCTEGSVLVWDVVRGE